MDARRNSKEAGRFRTGSVPWRNSNPGRSSSTRFNTIGFKTSKMELLGRYLGDEVDNEWDVYGMGWSEHFQNFFFQEYSDIEALIQNLTIICALVATLGVTLVTLIELPEFPEGNIKVLALMNRGFRCHFMPDETLDVCTGTIDCSVGYGPNDFDPHTANRLSFIRKPGYRCDIANLQAGYDLARSVDFEDAQNWIEEHYDALPKVKAMPSKDIAWNGFYACLALMTSLFTSVFLYISLAFSHSREDPMELKRWWFPLGAMGIFATYFLLLWGVFYFFQTLEAVVAVRFPLIQDYGCMVDWIENFHVTIGSITLLLFVHHIHTRLPGIARSLVKATVRRIEMLLGEPSTEMTKQNVPRKSILMGFSKEKEEKIGPVIRSLLNTLDDDMSHCAPLFEHHKIRPSQMGSLEKDDLVAMGLCVGDAYRVHELLQTHSTAKVSRKKTDMPGLQIDTTSAPSKRKSILGFVTGSPPARKKSMVPSAAKRRSTVRFGTSKSLPPAKKSRWCSLMSVRRKIPMPHPNRSEPGALLQEESEKEPSWKPWCALRRRRRQTRNQKRRRHRRRGRGALEKEKGALEI